MLDPRSTAFIRHFLTAHPRRTAFTVVLLLLAGIAEGVGLMAMLPLLHLAVGPAESQSGTLSRVVIDALEMVGLSPTLGVLLALIVAALLVKGVLRWIAMQQVGYIIALVSTELRLRLIRALTHARWLYFARQPSGRLINAVSYEAKRAAEAYRRVCSAFADGVQMVIYFVLAFFVSWPVALAAPFVGVAVVFALRRLVQMGRSAGSRQTGAMERMVDQLAALLPNVKPVKAMAREADLTALIESEAWTYNEAQRLSVRASEAMDAFREPILVVVIAAGLFLTLTYGQIAFSVVLALAVIFYRLMILLGFMQQKYQFMVHGESAFWSLMEKIREAEAAAEPATGEHAAPLLNEALTFENVTFGYGGEAPTVRGVSFTVPAGRFVTLIGPSGVGKTTLVDLMTGLLTPQEGAVRVDGLPLSAIDRTAWRRRIGYVPQQKLLFNGTVRRNVTLGDESLSDEAVVEALKAADAWPFVSEHPDGLDRRIGEQGAQVSGGQGQRLMIARALVHRPRLLILDEATTGLDPETERAICETLRGLLGRLTIVAISHQHRMQDAADVVYEVTGRRVERREPAPAS